MVTVIAVLVNKHSWSRQQSFCRERLRQKAPGHAGTRLPTEREHVCCVGHMLDFRKPSALFIHLLCRLSSPREKFFVFFALLHSCLHGHLLLAREREANDLPESVAEARARHVKYPPACYPWSVPKGTADMILIRWNSNCRILPNVILNRSPGEPAVNSIS